MVAVRVSVSYDRFLQIHIYILSSDRYKMSFAGESERLYELLKFRDRTRAQNMRNILKVEVCLINIARPTKMKL